MDREITADNRGHGHVAFVTPKPNNNNYSGEHTGVTVAPTFLSNGTWRLLIIKWDAEQRSLTYDLEGSVALLGLYLISLGSSVLQK